MSRRARVAGRVGIAALAAVLAAAPAAAQVGGPAGGAGEVPPLDPLAPPPVDGMTHRFTLSGSLGPAQAGSPSFLIGVGVGARSGPWRLDLVGSLGAHLGQDALAVDSTWGDGIHTYTSASTRTQTLLLELQATRKVGAFEVWAGAGVHFTQVQVLAGYDAIACTDFLCLGPTYPVHREDWTDGSFAAAPAVAVGARLALVEWGAVGLELRELFPATSRVEELHVSRGVGGLTVAVAVALRLGGPWAQW